MFGKMEQAEVSKESTVASHSLQGKQVEGSQSLLRLDGVMETDSATPPGGTLDAGPVNAPPAVPVDMGPRGPATTAATPSQQQQLSDQGTSSQPGLKLDPEFLRAAEMNRGDKDAEWRFDSSDAESSSSDSSSDESSEEESDDEEYELLDPEEQARILMQDAVSDDEGHGKASKGNSSGGRLRTKNEQPDEEVIRPDIDLTKDVNVPELGAVEHVVENLILIKAKISGEYQVLESGSVVCLEDRKIIGVIADTLGRVEQPLYSVRFRNADDIRELGISTGTRVFYVERHSSFVFTQPLKALKGSDASNLHDEEIGEEEVEFSDDEAEAEYKKRLKQERQARKASKSGPGITAPNRGLKALPQRADLDKEDELYTPLARPSNLHEMMAGGEAPVEGHATVDVPGYARPARGSKDSMHRDRRSSGRRQGNFRNRGPSAEDQRMSNRAMPANSAVSSTDRFGGATPMIPSAGFGQYAPLQQAPVPFQHFYPPQPFVWPQGYGAAANPFFAGPNMLHQPMPNSGASLQPGAFVNPAFFFNQQSGFDPTVTASPSQVAPGNSGSFSSVQHPPHNVRTPADTANTVTNESDSDAAFRAAQEKLNILRSLSQNPAS
ncbi:NAF1-domain-containing protein [Xylona heveae TC161]|uniref:H/ACA ribonucleoprotein complex non-core subunit NAF1 n=1 Tax=Xylona heveae (strain CBS 132557 / TC161) TaxID=1328760 RepID=A0A165IPS8_XYLHT|nr:NAF1-domain-containing protein [Xylona heveae TC161]KZF25206.1 NAF1-domain-containing protein [Xylona heveae TC161]